MKIQNYYENQIEVISMMDLRKSSKLIGLLNQGKQLILTNRGNVIADIHPRKKSNIVQSKRLADRNIEKLHQLVATMPKLKLNMNPQELDEFLEGVYD